MKKVIIDHAFLLAIISPIFVAKTVDLNERLDFLRKYVKKY